MALQLNPGSHVPIYQQIVDGLREAIAAGVYRHGEMLPSTRDLAVQTRVNPNTVHRAYEALEREGLIQARRGLGMFVTNRAVRSARAAAEDQVCRALQQAVSRGLSAGIAPQTLRERFDEALREAIPSVATDNLRP
jgi:GntR family transcriptional regulator